MSASAAPFETVMTPNLPPPAARWGGFPDYNFVGGHNAPEGLTLDTLMGALHGAINREGLKLATYNLDTGPQGYRPLRQFIVDHLKRVADVQADPDDVLITSGSLQGMDLINQALLAAGDHVIIEAVNYGGVLTRLKRLGVTAHAIPVDHDGMSMEGLEQTLSHLQAQGITPKYIYTIPTVQNPSATVMSAERRQRMIALATAFDTTIFEDDCYADLTFDGARPPAIHALDTTGRVAYLGSFSKSIAPALRVGYVIAPWHLLSRLIALKTDAGTGALEQLMLAEYCPAHFEGHIARLLPVLKSKRDALMEALGEHFGATAEYDTPQGGIFLWVKLPEQVDTTRLAAVAAKHGIAVNPGREWSVADDAGRHIRICYANPSEQALREGVARLADVCFETFGVPTRSANVER
ncbi:MAG: PLP-dependent aminotransferase family protein [Pseudomonadota bacterium]